jgi:hypothetical protein
LVIVTYKTHSADFMVLCRSPDVESAAARASVGGWGLGAGHEDIGKAVEEEEEDEPLDWDQAQVCSGCSEMKFTSV